MNLYSFVYNFYHDLCFMGFKGFIVFVENVQEF